jgi:thiol-disulfide isomerase/thioredoxin
MLKSSPIILFLVLILSGCGEERKSSFSELEVNVTNHQLLDSLIIYDKEESWEIKSTLRFKESNRVLDTMNILEKKLYQIYLFSDGNQLELGELMVSQNSKIVLTINENKPFESINYTGNFELSNNFLAYSRKHQHQLSQMVPNGIEQAELEILLKKKKNLISDKGDSLNIVDSLNTYTLEKFDQFSDILKQKNTKYLYKASLVDAIGNNFSFKDINNNKIALTDFKGKYTYIDVWATWCKPCKVEYVFLKKLEEHFINNDDFQIISISIDREYDKWETYIKSNSIEGKQLYSGSKTNFVKFYDIGALPRFIFLDKEGRIISPDEIRPSNPKTLGKLESTVYKQKQCC